MSRQIAIMMHFGRSGSTVLAKMLEAHPDIVWRHEYFTLLQRDMPQIYPMTATQIVARFENALRWTAPPCKLAGYEIKPINFQRNPACSVEQYTHALMQQDTPPKIVLLKRGNILKRILSSYRAMKTGVYHVASDQILNQVRFNVPLQNLGDPDTGVMPTNIINLLEQAEARQEAFEHSIRSSGLTLHTLTYEDDIENNPIIGYRKMLDVYGLAPRDVVPSIKKTGTALVDEIANYIDLRNTLCDTKYAWML